MRRYTPQGFTLVEIMIVVAIIALLAAIAIPNVLRGRTTANEAAAVGNLRALVSSLEMYRSVYQAYPANWKTNMYDNVDPDFGPPSFNKDLSPGGATVQGFNYDYDVDATGSTYDVLTTPVSSSTGTRAFHTDEGGVISHCSGTTATMANFTDGNEATIDTTPTVCD